MKARLKGAQTGRNLLKKKADALSMRFRQILRKIIEVGQRAALSILSSYYVFFSHFYIMDFEICLHIYLDVYYSRS